MSDVTSTRASKHQPDEDFVAPKEYATVDWPGTDLEESGTAHVDTERWSRADGRWNVNIRGTHGSGKTTISRRFIDEHRVVKQHFGPVTRSAKKKRYTKPLAFELEGGLFMLGRYQSGLDGIMPYHVVAELVRYYAPMGHVVWENVLVSGNSGMWQDMATELVPWTHTVWAFLDTPFDKCIERIYERREARAAEGWKHRQEHIKIDPIEQGWRRIRRIAHETRDMPNVDGRWLDHTAAYEQVHNLLVGEAGWVCETHGPGVML